MLKDEKSKDELFKKNMKDKILLSIRERGIKIKKPFVFFAQKMGLESALVASIILGAFLVSVILYFFKKNELLKFLSLGVPGIKVFLVSLPYDYLALFIATLILAIYLANKIELFCTRCEKTEKFAGWFFLVTLALGLFFLYIGIGEFLSNWSN